MREIIRHEPGTFCWPELATIDAEAAKKLYGALFGWTFEDRPAAAGVTYSIARLAGKEIGRASCRERVSLEV
jgi:predicted enzyme related to lactoylglutathione lyase